MLRLRVIADQESTTLGEPSPGPFDHPSSRRICPLLLGHRSFTSAPDVRCIVVFGYSRVTTRRVIALIKTQVLRLLARGFGPFHHDRFERCLQQLVIIHVGGRHDNGQRPAIALCQEALFRAIFGSIRGVGADRPPPNRALPNIVSAACHSHWTACNSSHSVTSWAQIFSKMPC